MKTGRRKVRYLRQLHREQEKQEQEIKEHGIHLHLCRRRKLQAVLCLAAVIVLAVSGGVYVYAKYYRNEARKGVASAADFYLSSDLLYTFAPADFSATDTGITENEGGISLPVINNTSIWNGTEAYSFVVNVSNYQNPLLYNDSDINVSYTIYFQMESGAEGYTVSYPNPNNPEETQNVTLSTQVCKVSGTLTGGSARTNSYTVKVPGVTTPSTGHVSVPVRVWVIVDSPDYMAKNRLLAGRLQASTIVGAYVVTGEFEVLRDSTVTDETLKKHLDSLAALKYMITSTGDDAEKQYTYKLTWNPAMLELNPHDKMINRELMDYNAADGTATLTIEPYSLIEITFYKADAFPANLTVNEFNKYVTLQKVN